MTFISILDVDNWQKSEKQAFTLKISTYSNSLKDKMSSSGQNSGEHQPKNFSFELKRRFMCYFVIPAWKHSSPPFPVLWRQKKSR